MRRRRFLQLAALAGAGSLLGPLRSPARAQDLPRTTSLATLSAAFRDAQRLGKPLLVLVVPEAEQWQRGEAFGELLNHGGDAALADLALAHVVCALMSDVRMLVPQLPVGDPPLVLVETDRVPASARLLPVALPFPPRDANDVPGAPATEHAIDQRIAALSAALHQALAATPAMLADRARVARAHLDAGTLATLDTALAANRVPPALADRGAAIVRAVADARPTARTALLTALVTGVVARVRTARVPGSVWGHSGCGVQIEGEDTLEPPCGMAMIPERSARFLYFYTRG